MPRQNWIAAAALAAAAGAAAAAPAAAQEPARGGGGADWQFRCPAPGTAVEQSTGASLRYRGPDAKHPGSCTLADGQRRLLGYWRVGEAFYRAGGKQIAERVAAGVPAGGTAPVTFDYFTNSRTNESIHVQETWRVAGTGPLTTPAGTFDTARVERRFQVIGATFAYTQTVWFDRATGAPVSARVEHLNPIQADTLVNWVATEVRAPGPQAAAMR